MDGISLAASIVAVIQITTSVAQQAYKYGQSVKNATEDLAKTEAQLKDVENILVKLSALVDRERKEGQPLDLFPTLIPLNNPDGALERCRLTMVALEAELTPINGLLQHARWPFKRKTWSNTWRKSADRRISLLHC
jgi:hypothetical protein